jgi:glycerol-3-phosphate dehydrogenase subunit B
VRRVVVVGAGAAGTGAAIASARAGSFVTVVSGGSGATTLAPGALDFHAWTDRRRGRVALDAETLATCSELDIFRLEPALLLTTAGLVRPAAGRDAALLDLGRLQAGLVVVPRSDHAGWDAAALAKTWSESNEARERGLSFAPIDAHLLRMNDERVIAEADVAARHDDPARISWLAERLREAIARAAVASVRAVVLPPWLGVEAPRAASLTERVGLPCGEALGLPGGPAGLRFERARDRALRASSVAVLRTRARSVERHGSGWRVELEQGEPLACDAVVLAAGGLVGGGLAYTPSHAILAGPLPPQPRPTFASTVAAPVRVGSSGAERPLPGSLHGEPPELIAWPFVTDAAMDRVGVLADAQGAVPGQRGLFAAGEMAADLPRTWLASFASGVRAGRAASIAEVREASTRAASAR